MLLSCPVCRVPFEFSVINNSEQIFCPQCGAELFVKVSVSAVSHRSTAHQNKSVCPELDDMYLDIETTGRSADADITVIVWLQNGSFKYWTKGGAAEEFLSCFRSAPRIVTFNGSTFDIPRVCSAFGIEPPSRHLDVRFEARDSGLTGGLKEITENLGILRPQSIADASGSDAVETWYAYLSTHDTAFLAKLVYYCAWDVYLTYRVHMFLADQKHDNGIENRLELLISADSLMAVPKEFSVPEGWFPLLPEPAPSSLKELWAYRRQNPLTSVAGAAICITGEFTTRPLLRPVVDRIVTNHGGIMKPSVVQSLDFLVVCGTEDPASASSTKCQTARRYIEKGAHVRLISENELWNLVCAARVTIPECACNPKENSIPPEHSTLCQRQELF